eukprot:scaffold767_cov288-Chaetoceros_neogracile.AAC.11
MTSFNSIIGTVWYDVTVVCMVLLPKYYYYCCLMENERASRKQEGTLVVGGQGRILLCMVG